MFSLDSKLYDVSEQVARLMGLTLLFIIFSLPIITMPSALTALIATVRQSEQTLFATFMKHFKENLLRSLIIFVFSIFSYLFLVQLRYSIGILPMAGVLFFFILSFVMMYNLNCYLLISVLNKSGITFFRQVFFFTLGTFYKTFFFPLIGVAILLILPIVIGVSAFFIMFGILVAIYIRMVKKELEVIKDYA